jgi:hypothetical protein
MPKAQKKNKSNTPQALFIIIVMAVAVVIAVYFGSGVFSGNAINTVSIDLPVIKTALVHPSTGEEYNVQTLFSIMLDRAASRELSNTELTEALSGFMQEMDIDRILGMGKVEYISTRATELLNSYLAEREITTRVLVVGLSNDDSITLTGPERERSEGVMKGIFENID